MEKNHRAINQARTLYYAFFAKILSFAAHEEQYAELDALLKIFMENPLDETSHEAFEIIQKCLKEEGYGALKHEYDEVFVSPESSFVPLTASYYNEGRDDGQKRVQAAGYVLRSKFRKNKPVCNDSEDQVLFLFRFMSRLIQAGNEGDEESLALSKEVFSEMMNEFIDEFIDHLLKHESSFFYKNTAVILHAFMEFERMYLGVSPSEKMASAERVSAVIQRDRKPLTQRVRRNLDEIVL